MGIGFIEIRKIMYFYSHETQTQTSQKNRWSA